MRSVSVVVPAYNSEGTLSALVSRTGQVLQRLGCSFYEMVIVNDGSVDNTWQIISEIVREHPWVRGVDLMRNYGQHNALLCGIRIAKGEIIVTIDDDMQNPPEEIPKLLCKLDEGYDVVYGTPSNEQHGLWRNLASVVTKMALQTAMKADTARNVSAFRAFNASVRDAFERYTGPFVSIDVLLTWGTTRFAAERVSHSKRTIGTSNYTFSKLVTHALNMVTGFSVLPLQIASMLGFALALFGVGVLAYVIGRYLIMGGSVPGFPFLASVIAIFSGAQLFALGILGEYLARIHFRSMEKPPYTIRHKV